MAPRLKLHTDDTARKGGLDRDREEFRTLRFPATAMNRRRLVAGTVGCSPTDLHAPIEVHYNGEVIGKITPTQQIISDVEQTIVRMQKRLDAVREDLDVVYRFPGAEENDEDDRPRAA